MDELWDWIRGLTERIEELERQVEALLQATSNEKPDDEEDVTAVPISVWTEDYSGLGG